MIGRVTSTKLKNTATVLVERVVMHPLYKKTFVQSKKYLVDDVIGVRMGDMVEIIKSKPISKNKHWKITKIVGKNFAEVAKLKLKEEAEEAIAEVMPQEEESRVESQESSEKDKLRTENSKVKTTTKNSKVKTKKEVKSPRL